MHHMIVRVCIYGYHSSNIHRTITVLVVSQSMEVCKLEYRQMCVGMLALVQWCTGGCGVLVDVVY
jgi:hypothetical protein